MRLLNGYFTNLRIYALGTNQDLENESGEYDKLRNTNITTIEMVTRDNLMYYETLTKLKGRLNISKKNPKVFQLGQIIDEVHQISEDSEYTFCVFKVNVGRSVS